jgi:hypothetical protein
MPKQPRQRSSPSSLKQPVAGKAVKSSKEPRITAGEDPMRESPAWHISTLETVDPFGWHRIDTEKLGEVRRKIGDFESMTWNEILVVASHRNHAVSVDRLCKAAQDRLEEIGQGDVDELVSLRLSGPERIWGIRAGRILKILWWDPEHAVCPALLRHT